MKQSGTAQFNHFSPKAPVQPSNNPSGRNHNTADRNPEITRRCKLDTRETKQQNNGCAQDGANILWQSSAGFTDFSKAFLLDQSTVTDKKVKSQKKQNLQVQPGM